ncbi:hypothetical protein UA08_02496 [Talaromyces atroroseus]|uniref:Uncharacterized protein n=1 Tax=Talaromyces atroroseus TaxID=1441469 RepID=A0A225B5Y4_TALAT|nr:hypothetical protein UA08_02496 [Talaromyces atroroseus]OKL62285.1 hypothetical protein UA08_02496 [Talaromyces atroroseus]
MMLDPGLNPVVNMLSLEFLLTSKVVLAPSVAAIILLALLAQWAVRTYKLRKLPIFNRVGWFNRSKAKDNWRWNARQLLFDGFSKRVMILSPEYANEIRGDHHLSFLRNNDKEFLGQLPGFEIFKYDGKTSTLVADVVRTKLTQALGWHAIPLKTTLLEVVARVSSRVFLGPELCRNPDWLRITIDYTVNVFMAMSAVKRYPKCTHRIVHWFLPETRKLRAQSAEAQRIIQPVIDQRARELAATKSHNKNNAKFMDDWSSPRKHSDAVQWMEELSMGKPYDAAVAQLGLSMAAIHTTTDLLTQVLYDLCQHPELIQPLREEIIAVLQEGGWKRTALYKLKLMDSVLKESQRLKPASMVSMRRFATDDVSLKDGLVIPKGSLLGVSAHWSWDKSVFSDPDQYDGYRFFNLAQNPETEKMSQFVSTSPQHLAFGHGRHACPGRFFAANEMKIVLAHILLKYDFALVEGAPKPKVSLLGWMMSSDAQAQLLIKRRREEICVD